MRTRNQTFDEFGPTRRPLNVCLNALGALGLFVTLQLTTWLLLTQWLAHRLDHQPALGEPWLTVGTTPLYAPWSHFLWRAKLGVVPEAESVLRSAQHASELATLGALGLTAWGTSIYLRFRRNRASILHGSGGWATRRDIKRANLLGDEGVVLGHWRDGNRMRVLHHNGPEGVLMFAPPRSGKGVGPIQSSLLSWRHSSLVLDPKGENYVYTSGWRKHIGQKVYCLNFCGEPSATAGFNPLDTVRIGTSHEIADAQRLAQMFVDPDGKQASGQNAHWAETSAALLTGAMLHVLYREKQQGAHATMLDVANELTDPHRNHQQVLLDWLEFPHDPQKEQGWLERGLDSCTHPAVAAAAREQLNREERERSAVLSSTTAKLALFRDPVIATNTSHSSFALTDLMDDEDGPVTLYLVVPPNDTARLRPLVRIFIDCALRTLTRSMSFDSKTSEGTHKHRLLLMLDEFPLLGNMPIFTEAFAYCAGYGIMPYLIAQDYEQLRAAYGDRETISSSCNLWLAYAPNKMETAQMLSTRLGKVTARVLSKRGGRQASESEQEVGRELMTAVEVTRLRPPRKKDGLIVEAGEMLIFAQGTHIRAEQPIFCLNPVLNGRRGRPRAPCSPTPRDPQTYAQSRNSRLRRVAQQQTDTRRLASQPQASTAAPVTHAPAGTPAAGASEDELVELPEFDEQLRDIDAASEDAEDDLFYA